ncbi:MAG: tRNA-specific 2-thiouridylase [Candidatus Nomurabacteria bacterium]|jgi:tRNA-specific 2-thiouridylase|nr:tRNA-specific 2-thiouridylase [Candidatus Nomurabacteria bacterium]
MSGGVDSSLSAALLVEAGYDVTGVYMKNWSRDLPGMKCPWAEDLADAKRVAVQLGIPFQVFDFESEYKHLVVDYMIGEYQRGRTPNPDVMCNQEVKFGIFLRASLDDGADMIATGHYAQIVRKTGSSSGCSGPVSKSSPENFSEDRKHCSGVPLLRSTRTALSGSPVFLVRGKDENKDQTYFLYRVTESALERTLFPIGHLTKPEVRAEAEKRGLVTAGRRDSQGICFVGNVGIREFLSQYVETAPGDILEQETGRKLGRHDGAIFYTFGQRHNLGVGGGLPYYVVGKDMEKNEVYVSANLNNDEFWREELVLSDPHWINQPPRVGHKYQVRLRHRAPLIDCTVGGEVVKLENPERAIAPGQSAVIYDGEVVLGGGIVT